MAPCASGLRSAAGRTSRRRIPRAAVRRCVQPSPAEPGCRRCTSAARTLHILWPTMAPEGLVSRETRLKRTPALRNSRAASGEMTNTRPGSATPGECRTRTPQAFALSRRSTWITTFMPQSLNCDVIVHHFQAKRCCVVGSICHRTDPSTYPSPRGCLRRTANSRSHERIRWRC